jgi:L-threonylcarbamoyladenylate synthase
MDQIAKAAQALKNGDLVALPTETVYGLAGDASNDQAIQLIFATKNRPQTNPLIAHIHDIQQIESLCRISTPVRKLMDHFWPGPLTFVLPLLSDETNQDTKKRAKTTEDKKDIIHTSNPCPKLSRHMNAGLSSLAVRMPAHPVMRHVLKAFGGLIAAPSANPSNYISPTTANHVKTMFKDSPQPVMILDGGACDVGLESTILDARRDDYFTILRPGSITAKDLFACCATVIIDKDDQLQDQTEISQPHIAPGQLKQHYAPKKPLRINASRPKPHETWVIHGDAAYVDQYPCKKVIQLSKHADLDEISRHLFAVLHDLDQDQDTTHIAIMPILNHDIGCAINDRLQRAAHS